MKMRLRQCPECGEAYVTDTMARTCGHWRCSQAASAKERRAGAYIDDTPTGWVNIGTGCRMRINFREADSEDVAWKEEHGEDE